MAPLVAGSRTDDKFTVVDAIESTGLWLAPIQGLAVACIGTLFFKKMPSEKTPSEKAPRQSNTPKESKVSKISVEAKDRKFEKSSKEARSHPKSD